MYALTRSQWQLFVRTQFHLSVCGVTGEQTKANVSIKPIEVPKWVKIAGQCYPVDNLWFNVPDRIFKLIDKQLHRQRYHPLCLIKERIADFMCKLHARRLPAHQPFNGGSPLFSLHDNICPVVTASQNFDSLLVGPDHPSRERTDTYYINDNTLLRSHTSAHQADLIQSGLNAFLLAGDVYRRDEVDCLHYPVFHQMEGVRLFTADELFRDAVDPTGCLQLLEDIPSSSPYVQRDKYAFHAIPSCMLPSDKQPSHTHETSKCLEFELKKVLQAMAMALFGTDVQFRWVEAYFPFTHPSWELEVKTKVGYSRDEGVEEWTELLGCGIMRQEILNRAGVQNKVGYAFGLGLERWAMHLYGIPDIRLFWSQDTGFLHQFQTDDVHAPITYKPVSVFPQCILDLSFWLETATHSADAGSPANVEEATKSIERDFYDLVRTVAGDLIEQVRLIDRFTDPKTGRHSHCYRLIYRDQHRTLTMDKVRPIHDQIAQRATQQLRVEIR